MLSIFLGAGFSAAAGVPLASQLFDAKPVVDRVTRRALVERVVDRWHRWHARFGGSPEEHLAYLQEGQQPGWKDAQWYVGLVIALATGSVEYVGMRPTITRHNLDRTADDAHERFWTMIFRRTSDVAVVTTNYDILPERGLRHKPRPRVPRPGFHYGWGAEELAGGGYPSYTHIQKITINGSVPIYKLHGSVSWSYRNETLVRYHDCRPAIRGDAAIVAPVTSKMLPAYLKPVWQNAERSLAASRCWVIIGYSLPAYDILVRRLFSASARSRPAVHVFDPDEAVAGRFQSLLPGCSVQPHPGLPRGLCDIEAIIECQL